MLAELRSAAQALDEVLALTPADLYETKEGDHEQGESSA
jgi:hypothetical protein